MKHPERLTVEGKMRELDARVALVILVMAVLLAVALIGSLIDALR